ncbi:MarR family winged helix-turn-helix transcriptional regulator [Bradyrhizobium liaoningense]|uniref:MarR family winged helix-turn-helix transcriptional regulator n=1 Tax=Bradyrhizobium liaoningense TaxID=43992 RepID=UPI001BAC6544|nr:MarR family transcriptional regulator [Bradyrhizobium liaoningense]MBR0706968.1 MarR family transcriptional regulator [Bradyrhizobium liaoningense]
MQKAAAKYQNRRDREGRTRVRSLPEQNLLEDSLAYFIRRAQVRCDTELMRYLEPGISPARLAALATIGANPGISQSALGTLLNIASPSVVKVVDDLEKRELLERGPSKDRRVYAVRLTEKGVAELRRYNEAVERFEEKIASDLTKAERLQLISLLKRVAITSGSGDS